MITLYLFVPHRDDAYNHTAVAQALVKWPTSNNDVRIFLTLVWSLTEHIKNISKGQELIEHRYYVQIRNFRISAKNTESLKFAEGVETTKGA